MPKTTQSDQVVAAVKELGGIAALWQINQKVDVADWATKTPFASIRRIVQLDERLCKIKPGLYCLIEKEPELSKIYNGTLGPANNNRVHYYYQGALSELGRMKEFETYISSRDLNKHYLQGQNVLLSEMTDLPVLPRFGYDDFMRQARTVDVIWFNHREMPGAFHEVEMNTNIDRSLVKFHMLQDFHADFFIVSPAANQRKFDETIQLDTYKEIRKRVKFRSTESVEAEIEKAAQALNQFVRSRLRSRTF